MPRQNVANATVRQEAARLGVRHWEIAACLGVSPATLHTWLRLEMPDPRRNRVWGAIQQVRRERPTSAQG